MRGLRDAQRAVAEARGEGMGADGMARAIADGQGNVRELDLNPRVMRLGAARLGQEITVAVQTAQDVAAEKARAMAERISAETAGTIPSLDEKFVLNRVDTVVQDLLAATDPAERA